MSGMVFVTLLYCRLLRYVLTMVVWRCSMFVLILATSDFVQSPVHSLILHGTMISFAYKAF